MKIGILTLPFSSYGGILQAYALQEYFKKQGHSVTIINFNGFKYSFIFRVKLFVKKVIKKIIIIVFSEKILPKKTITLKNENNNFQEFIDKYLNLTTYQIDKRKDLRYILDDQYNILVVGSDQIWRKHYTYSSLDVYFLSFIKNPFCRKISYAASFGIEEWQYNYFETMKLKKYIKRFSFVSVREEIGKVLCKSYFNIDAQVVLDPTLLNSTNYCDLMNNYKNDKILIKENYILSFILDNNSEKKEIIRKVIEYNKMDSFSIIVNESEPLNGYNKDKMLYDFNPKIGDWLKYFYNSSFIVTDSYHGCIFSILFNKPFLVINNKSRGSSRFDSILKITQLKNRMINSIEELSQNILTQKIDWLKVNELLNSKRIESQKFLDNALM